MTIDLLLMFVLIVLHGLFAMSEIAIVSAKRARLMQLAEAGRTGADRLSCSKRNLRDFSPAFRSGSRPSAS